MLFFGSPKNKGSAQPAAASPGKRRSMLGLLFNPDLGASIRPLGETTSVFVNLIAMIFAMNGLFPKNHPALTGVAGARLGLSEVLHTAWSGLSFTKEGAPKVALFFAVAGAIVLSILSIITALLLGFVGHAHAQTPTSFFIPANPTTDLAQNWLDYLFNPNSAAAQNLSNTIKPLTLPTTTVQTALTTALSFYSDAILVIAAFILFYHLVSMVVETAHHGVPMGKRASQIWAPIRLVVAIGLLVPVSSSGLNSGQYIVIQMAKWGSALASNVWGIFANQLSQDSGKLAALSPPPDTSGIVSDLLMMYACEYAYNYHVAQVNKYIPSINQDINGWAWQKGVAPAPPTGSGPKYSFSNSLISDYDLCGSYSIPVEPSYSDPAVQSAADNIYKGYAGAFSAASKDAAAASTNIQYVLDPSSSATIPAANDWMKISDDYQSQLKATLTAALTSSSVGITNLLKQLGVQSGQNGWIAAGAWFNRLSAIQAEVSDISSNSMPSTVPPKIVKGDKAASDALEAHWYNSAAMHNQADIYSTVQDNLSHYSVLIKYANDSASTVSNVSLSGSDCSPVTHPMECLFTIAAWLAQKEGVWQSTSSNGISIGVQFLGGNPLLEMASFGHNNIAAAMQFFDYGLYATVLATPVGMAASVLTAVAGAILSPPLALGGAIAALISTMGSAVAGVLFFMGVLFFTMGVTIAYIIPLLPFMHFFFNTITWIACVAESIIAIPLVALAHLNPEGEGLPGQTAKGAYYMIFSVMLRPVMMVFGLICGLLIMFVSVSLLNFLYASVVSGTMTSNSVMSQGHVMVSRIMYTVIYVVLLYSIANHAFALISRFPNQAMQWLGGQGLHGEKMGDPSHIGQGVTVAAGYFGSKGSEQVQSFAQGLVKAGAHIGDGMGKRTEIRRGQADEAGKEEARMGAEALSAGKRGEPMPPHLAGNPHAEAQYAIGKREHDVGQKILEGSSGGGGGSSGGASTPDNAKTRRDQRAIESGGAFNSRGRGGKS